MQFWNPAVTDKDAYVTHRVLGGTPGGRLGSQTHPRWGTKALFGDPSFPALAGRDQQIDRDDPAPILPELGPIDLRPGAKDL